MAKHESEQGQPISLPRCNVSKISLQPRALCLSDLREGEPRNSHPNIQTPVVWIRYSVPSGHTPPSHGEQVPGRTALWFASGLCTQISHVGNQNAGLRVQAGAGRAGMQRGLSPAGQEDAPRAPSGPGGSAALPDSQCRCSSLSVSFANPCHSRCEGAVLGLLLSCILSRVSAFQIPFTHPLLLSALLSPPPKK